MTVDTGLAFVLLGLVVFLGLGGLHGIQYVFHFVAVAALLGIIGFHPGDLAGLHDRPVCIVLLRSVDEY